MLEYASESVSVSTACGCYTYNVHTAMSLFVFIRKQVVVKEKPALLRGETTNKNQKAGESQLKKLKQ